MLLLHIIGKVRTPLEEKVTTQGKKYVRCGIGVPIVNKGQKESRYVNCYFWDSRFDKLLPSLKKDVVVSVMGTLDVSAYISKEGEPKSSLSLNVQMLSFVPSSPPREGTFDKYPKEFFKEEDSGDKGKPSSPIDWQEGMF